MTHDTIDHQFGEYMINQRIYLHRDISLDTVCQTMGVTPKELTEYLSRELNSSFTKVVHNYRIEEAKELWVKSGTTPICKMARTVGYGNSMVFLFHFVRNTHCLPHVWKRRNLIII